ncbi:MAG: hypothetical protein ACRELB_16485 [Polyangiaceae bacterium]
MLRASLLLALLPASLLPACARADPPSNGSASASASAASLAMPPPSSSVVGPAVPAASGAACSPGKDSVACAADGVGELTCAGSVWRSLATCRGPEGCRGVGSALRCDPGTPLLGDACNPAAAEPSCRSPHEALECRASRWVVVPCRAGKACSPRSPKGPAGCN